MVKANSSVNSFGMYKDQRKLQNVFLKHYELVPAKRTASSFECIVTTFSKLESRRLFASLVHVRGATMVGVKRESFEFKGL